MEKLRFKIQACIENNINKGYVSNVQLSDMIIEIIKNHKAIEKESCPRCASTKRKTFILGFHHICKECHFNY